MAVRKSVAKKITGKKLSRRTPAPGAGDAVDAQLARYREMRDFGVTAEPAGGHGKARKPDGMPFVIQKHAASHLHYDFRLGWNGVLKSWAVAKGPSYLTKDRRLAVQVEDHPMEYGGFEGIIPKGQYGGGTVMVWDQGTWAPQPGHEDVDAGLREGSLKFTMSGTKMQGKWTLVRMGGKAANERKPNWLLIKEHDDFERGSDDACITEEQPNSAVTGRSLEQIAANEDHVWNSKETAGTGQAWFRKGDTSTKAGVKAKTKAKVAEVAQGTQGNDESKGKADAKPAQGKKERQPDFVKPQLAQEATGPPETDGWLHELKLDGYRVQARKSGGTVQMLTRSGLDWTHRMPGMAEAVAGVAAETATMDGEVVVLGEDGNSNFARLQASFQNDEKHPLTYFAFDLLHLDGRDIRSLPLRERKKMLAAILPVEDERLRLSEHLETSGKVMFEHACELHAEGIISKRAEAAYKPGRGSDWLKSKCLLEQEFVVAGYTLSKDGDDRIGSLLLGYYDGGQLVYAGRTGTGFNQKSKRELMKTLRAMRVEKPVFAKVPADARRGAVWTEARLVAQVRFATWTADQQVRQAAFLGLREDKEPGEVRREEATVAPKPKGMGRGGNADSSAALRNEKRSAQSGIVNKVRLTHPDKVLDAESQLTKRELAEYYAAIAEHMLPHIEGRPLSLVRCPDGAGKPCFFQKHVNKMLPKGIGCVDVPDKKNGAIESYITLVGTSASGEVLQSLAQLGVLELHPWSSRNEDLEKPDRLLFDLDPDESIDWGTLCEAAAEIRSKLKRAGLTSFLKGTGGKGLHVVAPIDPELDFATVKDLAHRFVMGMERAKPSLYLTKMSKAARKGKIYLDYLRNERGATAVAPFSPRARPGVGVSVPLAWSALQLPERPVFRVKEYSTWSSELRADPWKTMMKTQQQLEPKRLLA